MSLTVLRCCHFKSFEPLFELYVLGKSSFSSEWHFGKKEQGRLSGMKNSRTFLTKSLLQKILGHFQRYIICELSLSM